MRCDRWTLGMDKQFHPTLYRACDYSTMLRFTLSLVSKRAPVDIVNIFQGFLLCRWSNPEVVCIVHVTCCESSLDRLWHVAWLVWGHYLKKGWLTSTGYGVTKLIDSKTNLKPISFFPRKCRLKYEIFSGMYDVNTLRPRQKIFQTTFSNAFSCMKMYEFRLRFQWSWFLRVQLTICQHCFR